MKNKLKFGGVLAIITGLILIIGGVWGICFTYKNVSQENIVTGEDASIPNAKVIGPLTLKSQADIIREHTLKITGGKTYAQMPRQIPKLDEKGKEILDADGKVVLVDNLSRSIWITATSLTTALNLAIMSYAFASLIILFGLVSLFTGYIFLELSKKY
ncbi:MAG: hypothetical protein KBD14_01850 [Candidatus Pacebacteria bacterium]|nr:hypothetical protein [Candidatus Paceibacterota bacterium]